MFFTVINHENILMFSCHFLNIIFAIYINFRIGKLNTTTFIGYYIFQRRFLYVVSQPVFENYQHYQHSHSLTISELFINHGFNRSFKQQNVWRLSKSLQS